MIRIKIEIGPLAEFIKYLKNCIASSAKTIDGVKEYIIAKHAQNVLYRCEILLLKYQQGNYYKVKSIGISDVEMISLNQYFSRYQVHSYLIPTEANFMEAMRVNFPQVVNVLSNNLKWEEILN